MLNTHLLPKFVERHSQQALDAAMAHAGVLVAEQLAYGAGAGAYVGQYRSDGQFFWGGTVATHAGLSAYLEARDRSLEFTGMDDLARVQVVFGPLNALLDERPAWMPEPALHDPDAVLVLIDLLAGGFAAALLRRPTLSARTPVHAGRWDLPDGVTRDQAGLMRRLVDAYGARAVEGRSFAVPVGRVRPRWEAPFLDLIAAVAVMRLPAPESLFSRVSAVYPGRSVVGGLLRTMPVVVVAGGELTTFLELDEAGMQLVHRLHGPGAKRHGDCRECAGRGWVLELLATDRPHASSELRSCPRCFGDGRDRAQAHAATSGRVVAPEFSYAIAEAPFVLPGRELDLRYARAGAAH